MPKNLTLEEKMDKVLNENTVVNDPVSHPAHYCTGSIEVISRQRRQRVAY